MVTTHLLSGAGLSWIDLRPNRALTWRQVQLCMLFVGLPALVIGLGFTLVGGWLVLPFSGMEGIAACFALWWVALLCERREVIRFSGDEVVVERGRYRPTYRRRFQRAWSRFEVQQAGSEWDLPRIWLCQSGRREELGTFLNGPERERLVAELRRVVAVHNALSGVPGAGERADAL